jgi:hypothetical protein
VSRRSFDDAQIGRKAGIVMRATLHHLAPNTYFEQQPARIRQWIQWTSTEF